MKVKRYYIVAVLSAMLILPLTACSGVKKVTDFPVSVAIGDSTLNGQFTGAVEKKQPNGQGVFNYSDGSTQITYTANWENGVPIGTGNLEYDGFEVTYGDAVFKGKYAGEAINGFPDGEGKFETLSNDFVYIGRWKNGKISGKGELVFNELTVNYDGRTFTGKFDGEVCDGLPSGSGEFVDKTEETHLNYRGNWNDGTFAGTGSLDTNVYAVRFKDGFVRVGEYTGDVCDGLAEGEGVFTTVNDDGISYTYSGAWKKGLYNGQGVLHWNSEDYYTLKGTFLDGDFFPTPAEFFSAKGTYPDETYTVTENALSFMDEYPNVFLENDANVAGVEYEQNFQYGDFAKNPGKFGNKLIVVPSLRVVQIFENDYWGHEQTFIIAQDGRNNVYYVNIFGYLDNVNVGKYIKLTALPLDYFTYPNVSGTKIWAIACAGVRIE